MKLWVKILLTILTSALMLFGGLIAVLMAALISRANFYTTIVAAFSVLIWLLVIAQIWGLLKRKIRYIAFGAVVGVMLLSVAGFEINRAYVNGMDGVSERDVDLTLYEPFRENTKAVSLEEEPTLKINEDIPRLDGATALYPLYSAFARAVYPENDYPAYLSKEGEPVVCTNTEGAYRRLITGETDIILVAGPSEEQRRMAKDNGVELRLTPIGREAFVFFVNAKNPINDLTISDIQRIYSGGVKNWSELGGKNAEIQAFQRPANSGSQTALIRLMGDITLMTPPSERVAGLMGDIITVVSYKNYSGAIGYSFLFFATEMVTDNKIKLLSLNGIAPTRENVANQTYPYASEFYAVTAGTKNPNAEKLIEWMLSEQGQYLVDKTGYTPISGMDKKEEAK